MKNYPSAIQVSLFLCSLICLGMLSMLTAFIYKAMDVKVQLIEHFEKGWNQEFNHTNFALTQDRQDVTRSFWDTLQQGYPPPLQINARSSTLAMSFDTTGVSLSEQLLGIKGQYLDRHSPLRSIDNPVSDDSARSKGNADTWKLFSSDQAVINYDKMLFTSSFVTLKFIPAFYDKTTKQYLPPSSKLAMPAMLEGMASSVSIDLKQDPAIFKIGNFSAMIPDQVEELEEECHIEPRQHTGDWNAQ